MSKKKEFAKKAIVLLKFGVLLVVVLGIPAYIFFFQRDFISQFNTMEDVRAVLIQYKTASVFIYLGCQVIQIVISMIPGQALQFAAGYMYGFWLGYGISLAGIAIGTASTFYLARLLGKDALYIIFGEERFSKFITRMNSKRAFVVIFILYLIPGFPKDLLGYAAGVSKMKLWPFLILSLIGRTPALMGTVMIGSMVNNGSYTGVIIISILAIVLGILGLVYHKKVTKWIDKSYERFSH